MQQRQRTARNASQNNALRSVVHCATVALGRLRQRAQVARQRQDVQVAAARFGDVAPRAHGDREAAEVADDAPHGGVRQVVQRQRRSDLRHGGRQRTQ
jgi:hypothetical protein